jgi:hypothetical protein
MTYYEAISYDPDRLNMFNMTMMQMEKSVPILGMYPFGSLKPEVEAEKDRLFIVDIGGGRGQALLVIQKEAGRIRCQDDTPRSARCHWQLDSRRHS